MNKAFKQIGLSTLLFVATALSAQERENDWTLVWSDEFNTNGAIDTTYWSFEKGLVRNNEAQWYQEANAVCDKGLLIIEARKERVKNSNYKPQSNKWTEKSRYAEYTSSSINTRGKFDFLYGRMEVRAKIPTSPGAWPAIWTLGNQKPWPSCGEIDIMEFYPVNGAPHILANAAWGTETPNHAKWNSAKIPFTHFTQKDPQWGEKFHLWRMDWDQESIRIYLDDELLNSIPLSQTVNGTIGNNTNPFKTPQYILLNLALGGNRGGEIDNKQLPMRYEIDYVRVYQKKKEPYTAFHPRKIWEDNNGQHINAHGGGVLFHEGTYYWFGEHKSEHTSSAMVGVTVYSSKDLYNWENRGVALSVMPDGSGHKIEKECIIERPKVIYNAKTKKFVMWFHLELKGQGYKAAEYGVAVSDHPAGPYKFLYAQRSCPSVWPMNMSQKEINQAKSLSLTSPKDPDQKAKVRDGLWLARDLNGGQMSRDMTLFVDDDQKAYHIFSAEENHTLHIAELSDDYLYHTDRYVRILPAGHNEAPAIFKKEGTYWMITSGCTGWDPNPARLSRAQSIWGPWEALPNPCVGNKANTTFDSQSTFILPVQGKKDAWIFMADNWRPKNPIDARYVWLPIEFEENRPILRWHDSWDLSFFK